MQTTNVLSILLLFLLIVSCKNEPQTSLDEKKKIVPKSWEVIKSIDGSKPVARHEAAFVGVGDRFYLMGGRGILPVSIFDNKTQNWTEGAKPPIELHHVQPIVYKNKIYLLGALTGQYPGETPVPNIHIYNPDEDVWTIGPEIPVARRRGATGSVLYNNKFYMVAGIKDGHRGDHKNWFDVFDPESMTWDTLPDAPRARDHFQAVVCEDRLYALAGRLSNAPDNIFNLTIGEVDVYDFKTQSWSTLKDTIPTQRAGNMAIQLKEEIIVLGGESSSQVSAHNEVEALHCQHHSWRALPNLIQGRHGTSAVLYGNKMYTASGCGNRGGNPELATMESLITL